MAQPVSEGTHRPRLAEPGYAQKVWRELALNSEWRNRLFSELVAERGQPMLLLDVPDGVPPGLVAVYGVDPSTGCVDTFSLLDGPDPTIRSYHCR